MDSMSNERIIPIQLESQDSSGDETEHLSGSQADVELPRRPRVANVNVPERIVICLDVCYDNHTTLFKMEDGTTFTQLNMLKRVVEMFIHLKLSINSRTLFALVALRDRDARWLQSFTNNSRELVNKLDSLASEESTTQHFQLGSLLEVLDRYAPVPSCEGAGLVAPAFVLRVLLLYARSDSVPRLPALATTPRFLNTLRTHPYVYLDILYTHEEDCSLHRCEQIYNALQDLDNGYSYVLEVTRNAAHMHSSVARLLAHPLQRVTHKYAHYSLN